MLNLNTRSNRLGAVLLSGILVIGAGSASAQTQSARQRTVQGIVIDTGGKPLPNAEVRIVELGRLSRTGPDGRFEIPNVSQRIVDLSVRRLGFQMRFVRLSLINGEGDSVRIRLYPEAIRLAPVTIEAEEASHPFFAEFNDRKARGLGKFITADDLAKLNTSYPSDAFRRVPGMRLVRLANGGMGVRFSGTVRMSRSSAAPGDCVPTIWVDGQAAPGMEVDDIRAGDIQGIEIYRVGSTPSQFVTPGVVQCGTIVVWTRRRGK